MEFLGFSTYKIMLSVSSDNFTSSFPIWMPFISFSCLITLARTCIIMLNRSGEGEPPWLFPNFRGKAFSLSLLSITLAVGFSSMAFYYVKVASFYFYFVDFFFYHEKVLNFSNAFSASIGIILCFFAIISLIILHWFSYVELSLHSRKKNTTW